MSILANKYALIPSLLVAVMAVTAGCGDETTETSTAAVADVPDVPITAVPMSSYGGPGSNWAYDLFEDGTFEVTRSAAMGIANDLTVSGSYEVTAAGFLQMTVESTSGDGAPATGEILWAVQLSNGTAILSPTGTYSNQMIPMVKGGTCVDGDIGGNWITVRTRLDGNATSPSGNYFGAFNYSHSNVTSALSSGYALVDGFPAQESVSLGQGYCRDGVISTQNSDIYVAATGSVVANAFATDADGGFFVMASPKSTIGSVAEFDGSYIGVASDDGIPTSDKVTPVAVSCSSGICSVDRVTDMSTGATAGQPYTLDLFGTLNEPSTGFATGQIDVDGSVGNVACTINSNADGTGQRTIACAGQSPASGYRLFNLILASAD